MKQTEKFLDTVKTLVNQWRSGHLGMGDYHYQLSEAAEQWVGPPEQFHAEHVNGGHPQDGCFLCLLIVPPSPIEEG